MIKKLFFLGIFSLTISANAQIMLAEDINNNGMENSLPVNLFTFGSKIYFNAEDATGNKTGGSDKAKELWSYDGSTLNFVKDINSALFGAADSQPGNFFEFNGNLYFTASTTNCSGGFDKGFYTTDGTAVGTNQIDLVFGVDNEEPNSGIQVGSIAYILARDSDDTTYRLVEFDGASGSFVANADASAGAKEIITSSGGLVELGGKIICAMNYVTDANPDGTGTELYEYDPNTDTFTLIKDINVGVGSGDPRNLIKLGNKVYFTQGSKLWETDGTSTGTVEVTYSNYPGLNLGGVTSSEKYAWNGKLFFEGDVVAPVPAGLTDSDQLFALTPNPSGTGGTLVDISKDGDSHDPRSFVGYNGFLYYAGERPGSSRYNLYRTDGVNQSTIIDDDVYSQVRYLAELGGVIYFAAETNPDTLGRELYSLDTNTLSTSKAGFSDKISVYPNPTKNIINVSHSLSTELNYEIFDISGRSVTQGKLINKKIKHKLNSGVYILKLSNNVDSFTEKIVVE